MTIQKISGFPEFLPPQQIAFDKVIGQIRRQFELYGFSPLDTPAVERLSTLLSKGNDHEIYLLDRLDESDRKKELGLRFDLTVPLARYVAQHYGQLTFPYRRYHIGPVWRGERPQLGRYRQFYQCDIDVIGDGSLPLSYDAEILFIAFETLCQLGLPNFCIKINHSGLLRGILESFQCPQNQIAGLMRILDKIEKVSKNILSAELIGEGLSLGQVNSLFDLAQMRCFDDLSFIEKNFSNDSVHAAIRDLREILTTLEAFGMKQEASLILDPVLARGLTYYTGLVCETQLLDYPELGSICSGGRYANLAKSFCNRSLPGVGLSIGISRLIPKMMELGLINQASHTPAKVLITIQNPAFMQNYLNLAHELRKAQIPVEVYLGGRPLSWQMKYADKKGVSFVVIADQEEISKNVWIVRHLQTQDQKICQLQQIISCVRGY